MVRMGRDRGRRPRRGRPRRRWFGRLAAPALALGLIALGFAATNRVRRFLTTSPVFAVHQVLVSGNHRVSGAEIVRVMALSPGTNVFTVDLKREGERIRAIRWIREVSVQRQLPDTLRVKVEERKPFALVQARTRYLVDRDGVILAEGAAAGRYRLPVVQAAGKPADIRRGRIQAEDLLSGLRVVSQMERARLVEGLFSVTVGPKDLVVMKIDGRPEEIRLQSNAVDEELARLKALRLLQRTDGPRRYIDLTFAGMAVTK